MPRSTLVPAPDQLSVLWSAQNSHGALSQPLALAGDRLIGVAASGTIFSLDVCPARYRRFRLPGPVTRSASLTHPKENHHV